MQYVFTLDADGQALMPCHPARARELLDTGRAAVWRRQPFTIILKNRIGGDTQPVEVKIDPGSRTSGFAVVVQGKRGRRLVWAAELTHRGQAVKDGLDQRRGVRRGHRTRHLRHRPARFLNRRRKTGWLPPSLRSRIDNVLGLTRKLRRLCPVTAIVQELVRFDMQAMQNAEISGVEYQQGTLLGYEVREYLLEKWDRTCVYCGATDVPLEIEHVVPRTRGGSDRVSNLTLACRTCNQRKGSQTAAEFGHPTVQAQARRPLKDAAAVNGTRWALHEQLKALGLPIETGNGGQTKHNRRLQNYPKTHWIDAACVGHDGRQVYVNPAQRPLNITAMGRGSRQMCRVDKYGFPRTSAKAVKRIHGFQTGDLVMAKMPVGKHAGVHCGRVAIRASGSFNLKTPSALLQGIAHRHCTLLQHTDGYDYAKGEMAVPPQV